MIFIPLTSKTRQRALVPGCCRYSWPCEQGCKIKITNKWLRVFGFLRIQWDQYLCAKSLSLVQLFVNSSVQLSHLVLSDSATPWIAAYQASLSITNSRSLLRLMSIKWVMPSSHLILCCPLLLLSPIPPSIRVFSNESTLHIQSTGQTTGVSASASVLPMNTQDWSPLGWTGWISLQSKGLSRVFSNYRRYE